MVCMLFPAKTASCLLLIPVELNTPVPKAAAAQEVIGMPCAINSSAPPELPKKQTKQK